MIDAILCPYVDNSIPTEASFQSDTFFGSQLAMPNPPKYSLFAESMTSDATTELFPAGFTL